MNPPLILLICLLDLCGGRVAYYLIGRWLVERFTVVLTSCLGLDKNSKESFLKKLQICMKIYDYKDESRDVKGKVRQNTYNHFQTERLNAIQELQQMLQD